MPWVYPRVCGGTDGNEYYGGDAYDRMGLSPRVRGNLGVGARNHFVPEAWVYPRVCGGTLAFRASAIRPSATGLSPRVRGNQVDVRALDASPLLPVYPRVCGGTAFSDVRSLGVAYQWVYPRVCGGTLMQLNVHHQKAGA